MSQAIRYNMLLMSWLIGLGLLCIAEVDAWDKDRVQGTREDFLTLDRNKRLRKDESAFDPWPKAVMPYTIDEDAMPKRAEYLKVIAIYEAMTCVRLPYWHSSTPQTYGLNHNSYMRLVKAPGCWSSSLGLGKGPKRVSCCAGFNCVHEIGHTLGLYHEQGNPMRDGWIRANWNNVRPANRFSYTKQRKTYWDNTQAHDITSPMHYRPWMFGERSGSIRLLFPELSIKPQLYYMLGEVSHLYHCDTFPPCHGKNLNCANDGYQTIVRGKCACSCPTGLDPDNSCKTPLRKVTSASWPKGQYALPKPKTGCPNGGSFQDGKLVHTGADGNTMSDSSHMMGKVRGSRAELNFCTRTIADDVFYTDDDAKFNWPLGNYCIYMKGDSCPVGFTADYIIYDVSSSTTTGQVPDGYYDKKIAEIKMCCQYQGFPEEPTSFSTDKPFALIKMGSACQAVTGMRADSESFTIRSLNGIRTPRTDWLSKDGKSFTISICHYQALDMDCGRSITLNKSVPEVTIEMSSKGRTDLECTWLIKGDNNESTLVFDFEDFNVAKDGKDCIDKVEVRHSLIGQFGLKYCGEKPDHSIRSITDKLLVRFFTKGGSESSFKAKIRLTEFADMCYDPVDKRGASYDGSVNYTRTFKPCLPWAQMSDCYHHPFLEKDMFTSLDGNACRNTDNSFRPWCYTDKDECQREYCDVCGIEVPHDKVDYCDKLKDKDFCTTNASLAIQYCAKTCFDQLPSSKTPQKKYTEITCGKPTTPNDGDIVGETKASYNLGETVQYKCNRGPSVVTSKCMTSGRWSKIVSACLECPIGFTLVDKKCYGLMDEGDTLFYLPKFLEDSYEDALAICNNIQGTLAAPRSQVAATTVTAITFDDRSTRQTWLGIRRNEEGTWVYEDGTKLTWTNWDRSEPDDAAGKPCALAKKNTKWMTTKCSVRKNYVCEVPALELTCTDAHAKCKDLVTDNPTLCKDLPEFVRRFCRRTCNICQNDSSKCLVQNDNPNVLTMTTQQSISVGESVNYDCPRFTYPTKGNQHQACLPGGVLSGKPLQCDECPRGFKMVNNACHGFLEGSAFSFSDAKDQCGKLDGFVAMPKSQEENDIISSLGLGELTWVGLTDGDHEGRFVWDDKSSLGWTNWAPGEPKANGDSLDCTIMNKDKQWINVNCADYKLATVCTLPKSGNTVCYSMQDKGFTYNGKANVTETRSVCDKWVNKGHCTKKDQFHPGWGRYNLEDNYCRNPDDSKRPWCYSSGCRWHYCDVCDRSSQPVYDARDKGKTYTGTAHITRSGETCGHWADKKACHVNPFKDKYSGLNFEKNYCRNYDNSRAPWCYKTGCHWEYCDMDLGHPLNATNIVDIRCSPPSIPDGEIFGTPRQSYRLGDEVTIKCKRNKFMVTTTCLTSGDWLPVGSACTECPLGYRRFADTCYGSMKKELDYDNAVKECGKIGGHLPRPKTLQENEFVKNMTKGKYNWIDARSFPDDNYKTFKWSDGTTVNWLKGKRSKFHCAYMDRVGAWYSNDCGFVLEDQVVTCAVQRLENEECDDFLEHQCVQLLTDKPSMCEEHTEFAKDYCRKTCGICGNSGGRCTIDRSDKKIHTPDDKDVAFIDVGQVLEFTCKDGFFQSAGGNNKRACLPNGQLTGSAITCQQCPKGFLVHNKMCYGLVDKAFTFDGAAAKCKEMYGFIASPKDEAESDYIDSVRKRSDVWLGASISETGDFRWQDDSKLEYENWGPGEPNREEGACVAMTTNKKWKAQSCGETSTNRVVCTIPMIEEETCYDSGDRGASYDGPVNVTDTSQTCIPWTTATKCPHNPFVKGDEQKNLMENYCRNPDNSQRPWCYVDADTCDKKYCNVCENEQDADYTKVRCKTPATPKDGDVFEMVRTQFKVGEKVNFACKSTVREDLVNTTCLTSGQWSPVGDTCTECPMDYELFNGQCYGLVNKLMYFHDAHKYCYGIDGGHIASPKTQAENDFVHSLSPDEEIWIGANDMESEGKWMWEDGSEMTWNNWEAGEPNNWEGSEDAAIMKINKKWDDVNSQVVKERFVCTVPKQSMLVCEDLLLSQCQQLLSKSPAMCDQHKRFANQFCAKTCGICL